MAKLKITDALLPQTNRTGFDFFNNSLCLLDKSLVFIVSLHNAALTTTALVISVKCPLISKY